MPAYYNDNDPFAAAWLRNLIAADLIAPGEVDERSITDVQPDDLKGYTQHHFFAGIGGWSYALRSSQWPDSRRVWTGSCPCQSFSAAGARKGFADARHLWPEFFRLIRQCRPDTILGEQVASKDALAWLDLVHADLEGEGYAVGAVDTCAAGVGAPHIRQRLYWVADSQQHHNRGEVQATDIRKQEANRSSDRIGRYSSASNGLADSADPRRPPSREHERRSSLVPARPAEHGGMVHSPLEQMGLPGRAWESRGATNGFWANAEWIPCIDGKARPVEPGTFPLAHGVPARVGRLRGYGNALVIPQAKVFIESYMDLVDARV